MHSAQWPSLSQAWASIDPQRLSRAVGSARPFSRLLPYGVACGVTIGTVLVWYECRALCADNVLPLLLELAVLVSMWYGGLGPGLCATGLGVLIIHHVFLPSYFTLSLAALRDGLLLALMAGAGVGSSVLLASLRQTRQCATDDLLELNQLLQERLHGMQTLLRLHELSYEPICIWDLERGIVEWNLGCEQLYGIPKAEALGQVIHGLLKTRFPLPFAEYQRILRRDGQWSGELWHTTRDGREVLVESRHRFLEVDGRRLVLASHHDITASRQAERALLQAHAELAQQVQAHVLVRPRKIA